ncbi:MAG: hypothetical protein DHS20C19_24990 [Acidimicrobiales bacterium]|nr:MAG: hypothetical protein DHS20C19_24990 [Acidimicrobiales bacterium]
MIAVKLLVGVVSALLALATLGSAIRTVVVPRGEQTFVARLAVLPMRRLFVLAARRFSDPLRRDAVKARFGPTALMLFPFVWAVGVILGCSGLFWALGVEPYRDALVLSGSSLTTLGFRSTNDLPTLTVAIIEGIVGLGLVALLISFLPTIYGAFSRRETAVAKLHLRATDATGAASPAALLARRHAIDSLDEMAPMWDEWEDWFVEVEETHTSFPILVFFRSPVPERSWVAGAGIALDAAALYCSLLALPREPRAMLMMRTGTLSLRRVCEYFGFPYDANPSPSDPIGIGRADFDEVVAQFRALGLPLVDDLDQAWVDYAGWRVNYDVPLRSLATFVDAPATAWATDRPIELARPRLIRRRS